MDQLAIELKAEKGPSNSHNVVDDDRLVLRIPWKKAPMKRRREIIVPVSVSPHDLRPIRAETRATLVASIARGRSWLDEIVAVSLADFAAASAQTATPDSENGRYSFSAVADGVLRLDSRTGQVSQCSRSDAGWACKVVPDERAALETEIVRLQGENATHCRPSTSVCCRLPRWSARTSCREGRKLDRSGNRVSARARAGGSSIVASSPTSSRRWS